MKHPQSKNIFLNYLTKQKPSLLFLPLLTFVLFLVLCSLFLDFSPSNAQVPGKDAIAIRVIPNPKNSAPQRWYKEQGFKGSPQSLTVDGYEAIRDGRTVYVNAANVASGKLYTNIYLISYNQEAEKETMDIFAKILEHWKFNTNITTTGFCSEGKKVKTVSDCTGTIGCWHFDGNFNDSSVSANNGTPLGGVGFTDGISGQAINLDGQNDYIAVNNTPYRTPSYTVSAWINHSPKTIIRAAVLGNETWISSSGWTNGFMMRYWYTNNWLAYYNGRPSGGWGSGATSIPLNTWTHLAMSYDSASGIFKSYKNGIQTGTNTLGYGPSIATELRIGNALTNSSEVYFYGQIDEVKIYNYALSDSEILKEYNNAYAQCLSDSDCSGSGYCTSPKANIIRDTKRLADLVELKAILESYKVKNGKYPSLSAGTYMTSKTVSTWPSWQEALGKELGVTLPLDPINKLGGCEGYDPVTCWSEKNKKFADPNDTNSIFELPVGSNAFVYVSNNNAMDYNLCSSTQSGYVSGTGSGQCPQPGSLPIVSANGNSQPQFLGQSPLIGKTGEPFIGYISASDPDGDPLKWTIYTAASSWASWSGAPILQNSPSANQKRIYAGTTGSPGDYYISITIDDGKGDVNSTNTINLTIKAINLPPVISFKNINYTPTRTGPNPADITPIDFSFQVKDSLSNYPLTITSIVPLVGTAVPGFSQTFVQTPKADYFLYRISGFPTAYAANAFNSPSGDNPRAFTLTVQDSYGVSSTADFTITVKNTPPFITIPASCSNTIKVNDSYSCQINATDAEKHLLTYSLVGGTFPASFLINSNGLISGVPPISDAGVYDIKVRVSDEYGYFTERSYNLQINAFCGDGSISGTEQCDDGNTIDTDACDSSCQLTCRDINSFSYSAGSANALAYDNNNNTTSVVNVPGGTYLKLDTYMPSPYIWVANSTFTGCVPGNNCGMVTKIRTYDGERRNCVRTSGQVNCDWVGGTWETKGQNLGSYNVGNNPSGIAVNTETGDVWIANRDSDNITKLDINGVPLKTCASGNAPTGIAIEQNGDVWVANSLDGNIKKISGDDSNCVILQTVNLGGYPYDLTIDGSNNIWAANRDLNPATNDLIQRINTITFGVTDYPAFDPYGITADKFGNIWANRWFPVPGLYKLPYGAAAVTGYNLPPLYATTGVAPDINGEIWAAVYNSNRILKVDQSGTLIYDLPAPGSPYGICGDSTGQVWAAGNAVPGQIAAYNSSGGYAFGPATIRPGLTVSPLANGDMTGLNRAMLLRSGDWQSNTGGVFDSGSNNQLWGNINYQRSVASNKQSVEVFLRASDDSAFAGDVFISETNWNDLAYADNQRQGRYLQIKTVLKSREQGVTPVLWDLKVSCGSAPMPSCGNGICEAALGESCSTCGDCTCLCTFPFTFPCTLP